MNRVLQHIMALLLASFFLVSFTGVRLFVHHCMGCGTSELVFAAEPMTCCATVSHDDHDAAAQTGEGATCCALPGSGQCGLDAGHECCEFEVVYLKGDFQLASHKVVARIEAPVFDTLPVLAAEIHVAVVTHQTIPNDPSTGPPPRFTGRSFVIYSHQIKIA